MVGPTGPKGDNANITVNGISPDISGDIKLPINGRNLILNSGETYSTSNYMIHRYELSEPLVLGETYTVTLWGKLGDGKTSFDIYSNYSNSTYAALDNPVNGCYSKTFTVANRHIANESDLSYLKVYAYPDTVSNVTSVIQRIKLEHGSVATDWSPAPVVDMVTGDAGQVIGFERFNSQQPEIKNVKSIRIGGRNYLKNPLKGSTIVNNGRVDYEYNEENGEHTLVTTALGSAQIYYTNALYDIENLKGKKITLSISDVYCSDPDAKYGIFLRGSPDDTPIDVPGANVFPGVGAYYNNITTMTFQYNPDIAEKIKQFWLLIRVDQDSKQPIGTVLKCRIKVEVGSVATDWTPAPEDSIIIGESGQIIGFDANGNIQAAKVGSVNLLRNTNTEMVLSGNSAWERGGWRSASSPGVITSIEIEDSPNPYIKHGWRISTITSGTFTHVCQDKVPIESGKTYTLSCYARGSGVLHLQFGSTFYVGKEFRLNETQWQKYSFTYTFGINVGDGGSDRNTNCYLGTRCYAGTSSTDSYVEICGEKLEVGSIATDWSPAPEKVIVGGKNYIKSSLTNNLFSGSDFAAASKRETGKITVIANTQFNAYSSITNYLHTPITEFQKNSRYTFSIEIKTTNLTTKDSVGFSADFRNSSSDRSASSVQLLPKNGEWIKYHVTVLYINHTDSLVNITGTCPNAATNPVIIEFRNLQLEYGNVATDYAPAPEDLQKILPSGTAGNILGYDMNGNIVESNPFSLGRFGTTLNQAKAYPTEAGIYWLSFFKFASSKMPTDPYGILLIFAQNTPAGSISCTAHVFFDMTGTIYFGITNKIEEPTSWFKITGTRV